MAKTVTMYGIKNCDTMKKARAWLDAHKVAYHFHDYKAAGIERAVLEGWAAKVGWEILLNRAGTTFRALPEADKNNLTEKKAIALMAAQAQAKARARIDKELLARVGEESIIHCRETLAALIAIGREREDEVEH